MLIKCPHKDCRQEYDVRPGFIGQKTKCKNCGRIFIAKPVASPDRTKPRKQVQVVCPNSICRHRYRVDQEIIGKKVRCPKCGRDFVASQWADPVSGPASGPVSGPPKMISVRCPNPDCGQEYLIPGTALGRKARCPKCRRQFVTGGLPPGKQETVFVPPRELGDKFRPEPGLKADPEAVDRPDRPTAAERGEPVEPLTDRAEPEAPVVIKRRQVLLPFLLLLFGLLILAGFLELQVMRLGEDLKITRDEYSGLQRILSKIQDDLAASREDQKDQPQDGAKPKIKCHPDYDFRKTVWGMSMEVVKLSEGRKPDLNEGNTLGYKGEVSGKQYFIFYIFIKDQLVRARYVLGERHKDKNDYLVDYQNLQKVLTKKYGPPMTDKTEWRDERFRPDNSKWGMAVSSGHLEFYTSWSTCSTDIVLDLRGENFDVDLVIEYASRKLAHLDSNQSKENGNVF